MKRRGFVSGWKNRRWQSTVSSYQRGQSISSVVSNGILPNYFVMESRGYGEKSYTSGGSTYYYKMGILFVSPLFVTIDGNAYRFVSVVSRSSRTQTTNLRLDFGICRCNRSTGKFSQYITSASYRCFIDTELISQDVITRAPLAPILYTTTLSSDITWDDVQDLKPYLTPYGFDTMTKSGDSIFTKAFEFIRGAYVRNYPIVFYEVDEYLMKSAPIEFSKKSDSDIVQRAMSLSSYKYWYGGAGQIGTVALADDLKRDYRSIWTDSYYEKALLDVGQRVADCSYLVNYSYGIASPGNHGPGTRDYLKRFSQWNGTPKNGMIAWKNGHTGIYNENTTIEMRGIDSDFQINPYDSSRWEAILYDPNINY